MNRGDKNKRRKAVEAEQAKREEIKTNRNKMERKRAEKGKQIKFWNVSLKKKASIAKRKRKKHLMKRTK